MSAVLPPRLRSLVAGVGRADPVAAAVALSGVAAVSWFSWPTLASLHPRWVDYGYSHGYLILGLAAWLAIKAYRRRPPTPVAPSFAGAIVLFAAAATILVGQVSTTVILAQTALPAFWFGAVFSLGGWRNARRFFPAIAYVYFAIPVWDAINGLLQSLTVAVVSIWLRVVDIPAFIDGNLIHIPAGSFEVAGGCSGLHYFLVSLSLGAFLGLANHERWLSRFVLFGLAVVTGLFANWVRVFSVIVAGQLTDMQSYLIVHDHYYFGWALFLVLCLVPMVVLDRRLPARAQNRGERPGSRGPGRTRVSGAVAVIALLFAFSILQWLAVGAAEPESAAAHIPTPRGWVANGNWDDSTRPIFEGAAQSEARRFMRGADQVDVYLASYSRQTQGNEVVYFANRPEGAEGHRVGADVVRVPGPNGADISLEELQVDGRTSGRRLVWFGRRIAGYWVSSDLEAKWYQVAGALRGRHDALVVILGTHCDDSCDAARSRLESVAEGLGVDFFGSRSPGDVVDENEP